MGCERAFAAQRDVYRMRYEMASIKERADQALRRQARSTRSLLTRSFRGAAGSFGEVHEIAKGDITAQTAERNPETGRRADAKIRRPTPRGPKTATPSKATRKSRRVHQVQGDDRRLDSRNADRPHRRRQGATDSAISVTKELWEGAKEQRREYEIADGKYREELDSMINALFDQEESMRKNADYVRRKRLPVLKRRRRSTAALDAVPRDARTGEAYEKSGSWQKKARRKRRDSRIPTPPPFNATLGEDRFGTPEEKRKECREMISEMIATNMRRKVKRLAKQNQQVDVEEFKMVLFDENCREYVDDILDSFNTFFEEGTSF